MLCYGSWVFFYLYFYPSYSKRYVPRGNTHAGTHTPISQRCSHTLISILISLSHCCSFTPPSLSQRLTSHERVGPPPRGLARVSYYHTVCLHQCTISIIGPVIETNHSPPVSAAQTTHIQISFHLSRKLERRELTCDPFLIFCQQFRQSWGGDSIFQWGWGDNLFEMYCITFQRMTKLAT